MQVDWSKLEDTELVAEFKKGKLGAFTQLVDRHQRSLINYFYHVSKDPQTAEDLAQEVFLRLYAHLGTYEPHAKFTTFLYRVARNLWIDQCRFWSSRGHPTSLEADGVDGERLALQERLPGRGATPVDILARRETQSDLRRAIDELPEEQKSVLILGELQGLKYQEISEILGIPVGTVKSRMHTAMEKLKDMLEGSDL